MATERDEGFLIQKQIKVHNRQTKQKNEYYELKAAFFEMGTEMCGNTKPTKLEEN